MSFDWRKYLILADSLYHQCGTFSHKEACLRAAVSRGYYAAFCSARNLARNNDNLHLDNTGKDHGTVKNFYNNTSVQKQKSRERKKVGLLLGRLRDYRNQADYVDAVPQLEPETQAALNLSRKIISLLQAIYTTV